MKRLLEVSLFDHPERFCAIDLDQIKVIQNSQFKDRFAVLLNDGVQLELSGDPRALMAAVNQEFSPLLAGVKPS